MATDVSCLDARCSKGAQGRGGTERTEEDPLFLWLLISLDGRLESVRGDLGFWRELSLVG